MTALDDETDAEDSYRPKASYLLLSVVWAVGYPAWLAYVLWHGVERSQLAVGDPVPIAPAAALGFGLWLFAVAMLYVIYDGVRNGHPAHRAGGDDE